MASGSEQKLPLFALTAMVVGSMVGAGIFSLPGAFPIATGLFIGWRIAAAGIYTLARVLQTFGGKRPNIDSGILAQPGSCLATTGESADAQ